VKRLKERGKPLLRARRAEGSVRMTLRLEHVLPPQRDRRRLRLFAVACCRAIWQEIPERARPAVLAAERYADGLCTAEELKAAMDRAWDAAGEDDARAARATMAARWASHWDWGSNLAQAAAVNAASAAARTAPAAGRNAAWSAARKHQLKLFWDIFPAARPPTPRLTIAVAALAEAIYQHQRWEDMPVLADRLEEQGCTDATILGHARGRPHARGCWLVDMLTGR
jgi:hypothetical protein